MRLPHLHRYHTQLVVYRLCNDMHLAATKLRTWPTYHLPHSSSQVVKPLHRRVTPDTSGIMPTHTKLEKKKKKRNKHTRMHSNHVKNDTTVLFNPVFLRTESFKTTEITEKNTNTNIADSISKSRPTSSSSSSTKHRFS